MGLFREIFTWWNGSTIGTRLTTWRSGEPVGSDAQGNLYYQERGGRRRWVIYNGEVEASRVPPEWHIWLHHTVDEPPTVVPPVVKAWEKPHLPNLTGTDEAYVPPGSLLREPRNAPPGRVYEAWQPE